MIKINLCPIDELESQYWYLPDVAMAAAVFLASFLGVQYYLGTIQDQIDGTNASKASLEASYERLAPDIARFKTLDEDIEKLNAKLKALKSITVSKISKYKPVIVVEHLQNLRPEGVWFTQFFYRENEELEIKGQALDNIIVAEFLTALSSTSTQDVNAADLRTQIHFNAIMLEDSRISPDRRDGFEELSIYPQFQIIGKVAERPPEKEENGPGQEADSAGAMDLSQWVRRPLSYRR